MINVELFNKIN